MYLVFTRMPGESYRRRLRSLLLYLCYLGMTQKFVVKNKYSKAKFLLYFMWVCGAPSPQNQSNVPVMHTAHAHTVLS